MLAGPKVGRFRPKKSRPGRTGSSRTIGAAYTGATRFRQCWGAPHPKPFETAQFARIYQFRRCFSLRGWRLAIPSAMADFGQLLNRRTRGFPDSVARIRCGTRRTLSNCNWTGSGEKRILEPTKAAIVSVTEDQPTPEMPRPKPP